MYLRDYQDLFSPALIGNQNLQKVTEFVIIITNLTEFFVYAHKTYTAVVMSN